MTSHDVKYFWSHASKLTYCELRHVCKILLDVADDREEFVFPDIDHFMSLIADVSTAQITEIEAAEQARRDTA